MQCDELCPKDPKLWGRVPLGATGCYCLCSSGSPSCGDLMAGPWLLHQGQRPKRQSRQSCSILSNCQKSTLQVVQKHPNPLLILLLRDLETCDLIIRATKQAKQLQTEKHPNVNSTRITISITSLVPPESCNLFHL